MFFKIVQANIPQIKATIAKYGECWFHGCGNIYSKKYPSDLRKDFTNPNSEEATYRIHFTSLNQVPDSVEQLTKLLLTSRNQEMIAERAPRVTHNIDTITVEETPIVSTPPVELNSEDLEFQRLLKEEEEKAKQAK